MKYLGLDYGTKRIGIALSDETGTLASGYGVYQRLNLSSDLQHLCQIIEEENVQMIILGFPQNMDGSIGPKAEEVLEFKGELEQNTSTPIELFDERLTSLEAERVLIEADLSRKKRKEILDQQAAIIILQGYLDQERKKRNTTDLS